MALYWDPLNSKQGSSIKRSFILSMDTLAPASKNPYVIIQGPVGPGPGILQFISRDPLAPCPCRDPSVYIQGSFGPLSRDPSVYIQGSFGTCPGIIQCISTDPGILCSCLYCGLFFPQPSDHLYSAGILKQSMGWGLGDEKETSCRTGLPAYVACGPVPQPYSYSVSSPYRLF
jgi:hypothetical protein